MADRDPGPPGGGNRQGPGSFLVRPPAEARVDQPPFSALPPEWFEGLCLDLAEAVEGISLRTYGKPGQAQAGIDLYGRRSDGAYVAWQAKRQTSFRASELSNTLSAFFTAQRPFRVSRYVVVGPFDDRDTTLLQVLERFRQRERTCDIELLGAAQLTSLLRDRPDVVRRYFGDAWVQHLCGVTPLSGFELSEYLVSAERAARDQPYPGVVPGVVPPPLADVYVAQSFGSAHPTPGEIGRARVTVDAALDDAAHAIFTAPAGGGKTSLLRTAVQLAVKRWQDGDRRLVPIHVTAADLISLAPTNVALAEAITRYLTPHGLIHPVPHGTLGSAPVPGARWLLCVDGVDEVLDQAERRKVLTRLVSLATDAPTNFKLFVATREMSGELSTEERRLFRFYQLHPLDPNQIREVVRRWFKALEVPNASSLEDALVRELGGAKANLGARSPLMLAMMCQLRASRPELRLPVKRSALYEQFVSLLHAHQFAVAGGLLSQAETLIGPFGPTAIRLARTAIDNLYSAIAQAAEHQMRGVSISVDQLVMRDGPLARPGPIPEHVWTEFVAKALTGSGLVARHGGEATFLHQTLKEYMAARHIVQNRSADCAAFKSYVTSRWRRNRPWTPHLYSVWEYEAQELKPFDPPNRKGWSFNPPEDLSYFGFLIDAWLSSDRRDSVVRHLRRLVNGRFKDAEVLLDLGRLGTALPDELIASAVDVAAAFLPNGYTNSRNHPWPGSDGMMRTWFDHSDLEGSSLCKVALLLLAFKDERGVDAVARFASDKGVVPYTRFLLADCLCQAGDGRGTKYALSLADDREIEVYVRLRALARLAALNHERAFDLLSDLAHDARTYGWARVDAMKMLAEAYGSVGLESLAGFVEDSATAAWERLQAARALVSYGDSRANEALAGIATDRDADGRTRVLAAEELARLSDDRGEDLLTQLARDIAVDIDERLNAGKELGHMGRLDVLADLAEDSTLNERSRHRATFVLKRFREGDPPPRS